MSTFQTCISFGADFFFFFYVICAVTFHSLWRSKNVRFSSLGSVASGCDESTILELICSWMHHLCFSILAHNPSFSRPRQSGARPPGGSCQRSCEIVKGRAERLTWQRLLGALCWRAIPSSPLPTCEDATITYWQWAGVISPGAIYSRLAERREKKN